MQIIPPHFNKSRAVNIFSAEDIAVVREHAVDMQKLCFENTNRTRYAIAHCQVTDFDPLRFFVKANGDIIINPVIVRHTNVPIDSEECCCSYPERSGVVVKRYNKITAEYYTIINGNVYKNNGEFSGLESKIFQHEIDHFDGIDIYNQGVIV